MEPRVFDINDPLVDNPFVPEGRLEIEDGIEGEIIRSNLMEYIDMQCVWSIAFYTSHVILFGLNSVLSRSVLL